MGIVFRQSIKTTIVTFGGALLGAVLLYISTQLLTQQQFGFSRNLLAQAVIGSQIVLLGIHSTLYVFISKYGIGDARRKALITLSVLVPVITTILLSVLYFSFKTYIVDLYQAQDIAFVSRYFIWLPVYVLLWGLLTLFEQYLSSQMRIAASTFIREILLRIFNILIVLLYGYGYIGFDNFMAYSVLIHLLPIAILWFLATKTSGFGLSFQWNSFSKEDRKEIFNFAIYHVLLHISIAFLVNIDMLMLGILDKNGLKVAGVYNIAMYIISIFQIPYRSMVSSAMPMIIKEYEAENNQEVNNLFRRTAINAMIVVVAMAVMILANMRNAAMILKPEYNGILLIVPILVLGRTMDMIAGPNTEMLGISKYYRFTFYLTMLLLLVITFLNYMLIPTYGIVGAAWANTIGLVAFNIAKMIFLWKKMHLQPFYRNSLLILLAGMPAIACGYYLPFIINPIFDTFIRSGVILVIYGAVILYLKPSEDIRKYINSVKKSKRLF